MNIYVKFILALIVVVALAEFIPEAVNAVLILILAGMIVLNPNVYGSLAKTIGSL